MPNLHHKEQLPLDDDDKLTNDKPNYVDLKKLLVFGLLMAILLGIWSISRRQESSNLTENDSRTLIERWRNKNQDRENPEIEQRISSGEKILIGADNNPSKQLAVKKFAAGEFQEAQIGFNNSLKTNPNDPEALIYLNNSLATTDPNHIEIGVSVPVGGSLNVTKEILRGVAQAQNEINKQGGIEQNGVKKLISVQIANDDNDPETVKQIATHFVNELEIMAVIGHNSSDASIAAAPIYQQGNLPMISPTSVARELSQAGSYVFRTTPSSRVLAETMAEYAVNIRREKVAVCFDSGNSASTSFKEDFSLALYELGGEISSTNCDFAGEDFNSDRIPAKAISDGSEALLLIPSVNKIAQALEIAKANQNRLPLLGNDSMYTYETLKVGQSDVNSLVLPAAWHPDITANSAFNRNARELWGMEGSWRTATAYDATKAILTALEIASTRQELQQTLTNSGFMVRGASGKVAFLPSGDRQIGQAFLIKVQPGNTSGTNYDFSPIDNIPPAKNYRKQN